MINEPPSQRIDELREAIANSDVRAADEVLEESSPAESVRAVLRLNQDDQSRLLALLPNHQAADLLEELPESEAAQMVEHLPVNQAAEILNQVESDEQADILSRLPQETAETILDEMAPEEAADARRLMQYAGDTAGGMMISEYLNYADGLCVDDVFIDLRRNAKKYAKYQVQYAYVTSRGRRLVGVLQLREMLLADPNQPIRDLMIADPVSVDVNTPLEELEQFFDRHPYFGVPVVDQSGRLVGVVRQSRGA